MMQRSYLTMVVLAVLAFPSGCDSSSPAADPSSVPGCRATCSVAADCPTSPVPTHDGDNWACVAGRCEYQGCSSDQECADAFQSTGYVCAPVPGSSQNDCVKTCSVVTDCPIGTQPNRDEDNWACVGGRCEYQGCNSDQECAGALQSSDYACVPLAGSALRA